MTDGRTKVNILNKQVQKMTKQSQNNPPTVKSKIYPAYKPICPEQKAGHHIWTDDHSSVLV